MISNLDSILGEMLFDGDYSCIYRNGIAYHKNYIPDFRGKVRYMLWENVEEIYFGGTLRSVNSMPSGEDRRITIVDSSGQLVKYSLSGWFRMKKETRQSFSEVYSFILDNISTRQSAKFLQRIRSGERLSFGTFEMTQDAFYFHKLFKGYSDKKDTACIKDSRISDGYFYIQYQEPNKKLKTKCVGSVEKIPNIHLVQSFIMSLK